MYSRAHEVLLMMSQGVWRTALLPSWQPAKLQQRQLGGSRARESCTSAGMLCLRVVQY